MSNIIGLNTKLFGLEKNIKQSEPTRAANDLGQLSDSVEKERVLNPIVSESYMKKYIEEHGGGGGGGSSPNVLAEQQSFHTELGEMGYEAELVWENNFDSTYYPTINVTFKGTTYNDVPLAIPNGYGEMGGQGPDFTNYPFFIYYPYIYTEQEETGTIMITGEEVLPTVKISFTNQVATPAGITFINGDGKLDYTEITSETKSIEVLNVEDNIIGITTGKMVIPPIDAYITVTGNDITLYAVSKTTIYYYCHFNNAGSTPSITIRLDNDGGDSDS